MRNKEEGSEAQLIAAFAHSHTDGRVCPFSSISSPSQLPKCPSPPLLSLSHLNALLPDHLSASSSSDGGGKEERREAVAHLNGYPAYRLPCHVSLRRFLGRYNDADTRPDVVWDVAKKARKRVFPSVENGSKTIYHRRRQIHRAEAVSILGSPSLPLPRALVGATDNADLVWFGAAGWRWWWRATAAANTDCPYLLVCSHCGCPLDPKEIGIYFDASGRKRMRS